MDIRNAVCTSMSAGRRHGLYRFSLSGCVFYVEAHPETDLKDSDYGFPPAILACLTPRPLHCNWADIVSSNRVSWSKSNLPEVEQCWHPEKIDLRELEPIKYLTTRTCQVIYRSKLAVAKIARFSFEIERLQRETNIYQLIEGKEIGPSFLGHLMEERRVMGLLVEYVPHVRPAIGDDIELCREVLRKLHGLAILHNDLNKYNFLILETPKVFLCDFETCDISADEEAFKREEESLVTILEENFRDSYDDWSYYGQERLKDMCLTDYRI